MTVTLEILCGRAKLFEPALRFELLGIGAPKRFRSIYASDWRKDSTAFSDGDAGNRLARRRNNRRAERDDIVVGSLPVSWLVL